MHDSETGPQARRCKFDFYLLVFCRYVVLASTAIACYCLCYLAYQHNEHYCTWAYCTDEQKKNIPIPLAEIIFIATCVLGTLESMFSTWRFLQSGRRTPDYKLLLKTSTPITMLYIISYRMFYNLPTVIVPCPPGPNNPGRDVREAPETYDCCIAIGVLIAGGIALVFQAGITLIAALAVASSWLGKKRISLEEGTSVISITIAGEKDADEGERELLLGV